MSDFYENIYDLVRLIPKGRVTSYGAIAKYLSSPQASRMVGWAMNRAHSQENYVPAHRVVNRLGILTGKHHFAGENLMQELLESEGIEVKDDKIQNFSAVYWDPSIELTL